MKSGRFFGRLRAAGFGFSVFCDRGEGTDETPGDLVERANELATGACIVPSSLASNSSRLGIDARALTAFGP
jgi:hypothetical protein